MSIEENPRRQDVHRIEITGDLGRHAVEALQIEIRRLAKGHGIEISALRIERLSDDA